MALGDGVPERQSTANFRTKDSSIAKLRIFEAGIQPG
jgi:hypothetical protein